MVFGRFRNGLGDLARNRTWIASTANLHSIR